MGDIQAEFEPIKRNGTNINAQLQREKAEYVYFFPVSLHH
jgi:hypothetical protein